MSVLTAVATVPDAATAELLREVLVEGGVEDVEIVTITGIAYMPRAHALQFEVRVQPDELDRAQLVLRDYAEVIGPAAISESDATLRPDAPVATASSWRGRWVLWVAAAAVIALLLPRLLGAMTMLGLFLHDLF